MARKRRFSTFSLSFLDIMSCGFGAVALIFLIIKHDVDNQIKSENQYLLAEVNLLEEEVRMGQEQLVRTRNTLSAIDDQLAEAHGLSRRIIEDINATQGKIAELDSSDSEDELNKLKEDLKTLEEEKKRLEEENRQLGNDVLRFVGEGDRQYLTGLKLGGARILILLDASSSMLDDTIVNIIRRRNMSDETKRASRKWQRAIRTIEWLTAQFPTQGSYQLYTFNTNITAAIDGTEGEWLETADRAQLEQSVRNLRQVIPDGGTSLERAFRAVHSFPTLPDNIFLITDGLPTQGLTKPKRNTVTGPERVKLFNRAVEELPRGIPVNVILAPMEGDPMAAAAFWNLAYISRGSFLSPSKDWP